MCHLWVCFLRIKIDFASKSLETSVIGASPNIWQRYATPGQGDQSYLSFSVKMNPDERVLGVKLIGISDCVLIIDNSSHASVHQSHPQRRGQIRVSIRVHLIKPEATLGQRGSSS
ncbi:hypothetical protein CDAR_574771 [Caerostris darwini]|uniref:Uncharacterized protein n=1 Tax=Caerostris darwini TaxID=1538125 RepID=A0AAV4SXP2_9ARAC|nr:hypothetical protein CDAR_574771 [Caerostris darwini]